MIIINFLFAKCLICLCLIYYFLVLKISILNNISIWLVGSHTFMWVSSYVIIFFFCDSFNSYWRLRTKFFYIFIINWFFLSWIIRYMNSISVICICLKWLLGNMRLSLDFIIIALLSIFICNSVLFNFNFYSLCHYC